jgi:hypothetical protein
MTVNNKVANTQLRSITKSLKYVQFRKLERTLVILAERRTWKEDKAIRGECAAPLEKGTCGEVWDVVII